MSTMQSWGTPTVNSRRVRPSKWKRAFRLIDSGSDFVNALIPVVILALGVGLILILPRRVTQTIWKNAEQRAQFLEKHQASIDPAVPLILVKNPCPKCQSLAVKLDEAHIPYVGKLIAEDPFGIELAALAKSVTGVKEPPWVILGNDVVEAEAQSVEQAYSAIKK